MVFIKEVYVETGLLINSHALTKVDQGFKTCQNVSLLAAYYRDPELSLKYIVSSPVVLEALAG